MNNTENTKAYYDMLIDAGNDPVRDSPLMKQYMDRWDGERFRNSLFLNPSLTVLEIGVGTGRLAVKVCNECGSFWGIDLSPKTIQRAEENLSCFGNVRLVCGDYLEYQFPIAFDLIYSSLTFLHIRDKSAAVRRTAALLNPGGRFVLALEKNQDHEIKFGDTVIRTYPDNREQILFLLSEAGMVKDYIYETEYSHVLLSRKPS